MGELSEVGLHGDGSAVETPERSKALGKVKHSGFGLEPSRLQGIGQRCSHPFEGAWEL